jgi:hypothetical protein
MLDKKELLDLIKNYPLLNQCFSKYVTWICENIKNNYQEYDLIKCLIDSKEFHRLDILEESLNQSQKILRISEEEFCNKFGFTKRLLTNDPETIHDILAETLFVLELDKNHFYDIQKLPNSIKNGKNKIPIADFIATLKKHKYAIEIKTIRIGDKSLLANNNLSVDISKEYWWGKMFLSNAITKIESKRRKLFDQLNNTCKCFNCDKRMLVLYIRRLGTSCLMDIKEFHNEFRTLKEQYPTIDCFSVKTYYGEVYFSCSNPCFTTFKSF